MTEGTIIVSVIVPVYNDPEGIRRIVPALKQQDIDKQYEVILVDNDSTDATHELLVRLTGKYENFHVAEYTKKQSSYAARNEGIRQAEGRIFAFTDADCRPAEDWLRQGVSTMLSSGVGLVSGAVKVEYREETPSLAELLDGTLHMNQKKYLEEGWGGAGNLFVRRKFVRKYGAFDPELISGGDSEFGRRLTGQGVKITHEETAVVHHPARRTLRGLLAKEWRIGRGIRDLARSNRLEWDPVSLRDFLPRQAPGRLRQQFQGVLSQLQLFLAYNLVRLTNVIARMSIWNQFAKNHDRDAQ